MKIVVEIDCRDPQFCTDCDYQLTRGRPLCRLFRAELNNPNGDWSQIERCDECKAASAQIYLSAKLLDLAAERFSHRGCSDFDLVKGGGLTVEESKEIQKLVNKRRHPDDACNVNETHGDDWVFMQALASEIEGK